MSAVANNSTGAGTDTRRAELARQLREVVSHKSVIPLSFAQERLWFLDQLEPGSAVYNVPVVARLTGELDRPALERALEALVRRHEILRTRFISQDGSPAQVIDEEWRLAVAFHDFSGPPEAECEVEARAWVRSEANRPFDLSAEPALRAALLRLREKEHWLVLNFHHIVSDEWSVKVCFRELGELYAAARTGRRPDLPPLPIQYADYAAWQRESLRGERIEEQFRYWNQQLGGSPPVLELPVDHRRPPVPTLNGSCQTRTLRGGLGDALKQLAAGQDATVFMALLAGFAALLHRYTQQEDIVIGTPVAGRNQPETEPLIGFFVNTVMLRTDLSGDPAFDELLRRERGVTLGACAHQDVPFEKLVERLHPERTLDHMPFTRVMFAVQSGLWEELSWPQLKVRFLEVESDTAKFDLTFVVQERDGQIVARAEYNRDLFERESIARLLRHYEMLLEGAVRDPLRRVSELPLLTVDERHQLLVEWNSNSTQYPRDKCVHELFEAQAKRRPDDIAVAFPGASMTYAELNARANQLARRIRKSLAGPDVPVAVCMERSAELIVAILAVLKAGGAYVPLDPAYPKERLAFMLSDCGAPVLLTQRHLLARLPHRSGNVFCVDTDWELIASDSHEDLPEIAGPLNLAYVMYTSGSTGQPKGVAVPHRAVVRLVLNSNFVQFSPADRVAQVSNISFDAATIEIWGALLNGAQLVGIARDVALSPQDFARELREQRISFMFLTCALFNQLTAEVPGVFLGIRVVMFGGEAADPRAVREVLQCGPPQHLINGYGPTENTTFSACHEVVDLPENAGSVPIGRPISNTQCYVLDSHMNPVPVGVPGELHVGGDGLARGYWNRPELTAGKFVANPFGQGPDRGILYKTGDMARWLPDGTLDCLGRVDQQVKIRGFRVEPGEIEAALNRHSAIRESVVVLRDSAIGGRRLVAYFVPAGKRDLSTGELLKFLKDKLPDYMVPALFVPMETLPLSPNGKLDRSALPEPDRGRPRLEKGYATPRDAVELKLTEIWGQVLGVHPIGIEDKFFDLGGHSLLAVKLIAQIEKTFGRRLRLATIFQAQTIEQLGAIIREEITEGSAIAGTSLVEIQGNGGRPPIFFVHGAGGGMFWGYVNLSRQLGTDHAVYGLKSRGLDGGREEGTIEAMAAQYVQDIRALQPRGPYHLGGYCFGGNVAYEMARQLTAQGEEVSLLALMNCAPANSSYGRIRCSPRWVLRFVRNLVYWANYCRQWSAEQRREFFLWKKRSLKRRLERLFGEPVQAAEQAGELVDLSSYSAEQRRLWETHIKALASYHPKPYSGKVHLFRSPGHRLLCSFDEDYGWSELAAGGVRICTVPGVHERILQEPCVEVVAGGIKEILEEQSNGKRLPRPTRDDRGGPNADESVANRQEELSSKTSRPQERAEQCSALRSAEHGSAGTPTNRPLSPNASDRIEYWRRTLEGAPALLDLPADRPRPATLSGGTQREEVLFSREFSEALDSLAHEVGCSSYEVLLAGFFALLSRYTGCVDIVTGAAMERAGDCGPQPVRGDLSGDPNFRELVGRVRRWVREAERNAMPADELPNKLGITRQASHAPLFQVVFTMIDGGAGDGCVKPDLVLRLSSMPEGLSGWFEYSVELFEGSRIGRMVEHLGTLLEGAVADPTKRLSLLPLLPETEARQVLLEWNAAEATYAGPFTLTRLFEAQVQRTPDAVALIAGDERLSYRELNERANQLAHVLRSFGVGPESLVGICLDRTWHLVASMLAVLKAGGAYVPLDPAYPEDRLAFILEDSRAPVLITKRTLNRLPASAATRVICVDSQAEEVRRACRENPFSGVERNNLAYIIYTSGSTGRPKGVALEHRNAAALVHWAKGVFSGEEIAGVLASTSICFDLSVFEIFVPLSWGGTVVLAENALALARLAAVREVTMINTVPSAIREMLRVKAVPASVRVVNLAGEPLATPLVDRIYSETSARKVYDLYGPSETTTYSTFTLRRPNEPASIGRPLANEQVYLLDANRQPVPVGIAGEIYIGGAGVARGYLNRPDLTEEKFVVNPFHPATRLYRTGDLGRWRPDGNLEFLGRMDHQVKVRGFRIEIGEIESILRQHPSVREVVVVAREEASGDKRLAAYVVPRTGTRLEAAELREFTRSKLPDYMVPSWFVVLEAMPQTPNGKVDRKALPAPEKNRAGVTADYAAPSTPAENRIAAIWSEVLGVPQAGVNDNFFESGGHSLLATLVISRIREALEIELSLSAIFDAPTISALARMIESGQCATRAPETPVEAVPRGQPIPASYIQDQLWFIDQLQPGNHGYHVPMAFRLEGNLDPVALRKSLNEIIRRHEALRTTFTFLEGGVQQVIASAGEVDLRKVDLRGRPAEAPEQEARALMNAEARQPFDLARGPLLRVRLLRLAEADHLLLVVAHHAVFDGWSWSIFFNELGLNYNEFAAARSGKSLPELRFQYADYACWRRRQMSGNALEELLGYWKQQLRNAPAAIDLPADRTATRTLAATADRRTIRIAAETAEALTLLGRRERCSLFMMLLSALAVALEKWSGQRDVVIGTVVAGRTRREWEDVIGCFMNFLPIRIEVDGSEAGEALLSKVRSVVLEAQAHQDCPFEKIVEAINPERRLDRNPLFNVAFLLQNFPAEMLKMEGVQVIPAPVETSGPLVDLRFEAVADDGGLQLLCEYKTDLFDAGTVEQFLDSYRGILETLAKDLTTPVSALAITPALETQAERARERNVDETLAIAATFTAEPVAESLQYWTRELEMPFRVEFAPFNQVFQQLLDPASLLGRNKRGANVLLIRLEDWLEVRSEAPVGGKAEPANMAREFVAAVRSMAKQTQTPLLVFLCPASPQAAVDPDRAKALEHAGKWIAEELGKSGEACVVTAGDLLELYPVADFYDAVGDELGRVPYRPVFFTALGTMIVRRWHALRRRPPKVIVLDCDQTLWTGVCGEDGATGIQMDEPRRALQLFLRAQRDAGRLLAVCSKNNEEDVEEVFAQRLDMPLRREHFAAWRVNWQPKSENLKSLAAELNLGLDSFIFIDDNPVECAEVEAHCPEVLVLQLPESPEQIPGFLRHCWILDSVQGTEEDRLRSQRYQENRLREEARSQAGGLAQFIAGLQLKVEISPMTPGQAARVAQLSQRTNQFNCTTVRRAEAEIRALSATAEILTVSVADRFGDYGLVGAVVWSEQDEKLDVETFLLSCRVLGRGIEHQVIAHLGRLALERRLGWVNVHYGPSTKNKPAFDFLQGIGAQFQALNGGYVYGFPAPFAADVVFDPPEAQATAPAAGELAVAPTSGEKPESGKFRRWRAMALEAGSAALIHSAIERKVKVRAGAKSGYLAPQTEMERQLCELWQRLLHVERVGAADDFFSLGGHSLLAVRLFAELETLTGRKLPLVTIFQAPTVSQLARALDEATEAPHRSPIVPVQPAGSRPPLFLVHGAGGDVLWGYANLAKHMHPDQPIYGIKSRGQVGLEEFDRIEDMARYYLEELRAIQANGPYYLGGYCFGGNVAYEMARQLHARGEPVALVALLDAFPSNAGYERATWWRPGYAVRFCRNLSCWLKDFATLDRAEQLRFLTRKARVNGRKMMRRLGFFRKKADFDLEAVIDPSHFPERELKFWQVHLDAIERHVEQPYDGCVTLIRTRGQPLWCSLEEDFCWRKLARGGVTVKGIPGSHENIFVEPNVQHLATELENCLAEARRCAGAPVETQNT